METKTEVAPVSASSNLDPRAHYEGVLAQAIAEATDVRIPQLVALFKLSDERGKKTILALAGVQAGFARNAS